MFFTIKQYLHLNCVFSQNWIVWNRTIFIKMDLALNNLQRLIRHKTQTTNQSEIQILCQFIMGQHCKVRVMTPHDFQTLRKPDSCSILEKRQIDLLLRYCHAVYNQDTIERLTKGCIPPFLSKDDLRIVKIYRSITITSIAVKIYNALLLNSIEPEIEKVLWKSQNDFRRKRSPTSQILTIHRILEGICQKNFETTFLFIDFSRAFDSIHRGKMEQILLLPKETIAAIIMLY